MASIVRMILNNELVGLSEKERKHRDRHKIEQVRNFDPFERLVYRCLGTKVEYRKEQEANERE